MTLWKQIIVLVTLLVAMRASRTYASYDTAESYLNYCNFTQEQAKYVLEKSNEVRNKDHYIKWIWAIAAHEMGSTFVDWQTKFFAGRLHPAMKYKDFKTQVDWRTTAYNKYRYKNNTASDWINRSKYCVSDTHWWGEGCPNWVRNVPSIASLYKGNNETSKVELKRNVASKIPAVVAWSKRCKIIMNAPADGYIQIDSIRWKLLSVLRWVKKTDKIFFCWDVN